MPREAVCLAQVPLAGTGWPGPSPAVSLSRLLFSPPPAAAEMPVGTMMGRGCWWVRRWACAGEYEGQGVEQGRADGQRGVTHGRPLDGTRRGGPASLPTLRPCPRHLCRLIGSAKSSLMLSHGSVCLNHLLEFIHTCFLSSFCPHLLTAGFSFSFVRAHLCKLGF